MKGEAIVASDMLEGTKVIELSMYAFGPSCAAVLADWGADVIKIVPPTKADPMMNKNIIAGLPEPKVDIAFMWEQLNRGKRCIGLDVSSKEGRAILLKLAADADVFITNLLPGARERFGVDVDDLKSAKEDIIYARASGHGNRGPERDEGGYDHTDFWARTGMAHGASMVSDEFVPQPGPAMGDSASGAFMAGGIAAALLRRARTGKGAIVDVSLLSSGSWMFAPAMIASKVYGVDTIPRRRHAEQPNPLVAAYTTKDGRQIYFAGIRTDKGFAEFTSVVGKPELATDPRFVTAEAMLENSRQCIEEIDSAFAKRDLAEWLPLLEKIKTPWTIIQTAKEGANDRQVEANGYIVEIESDGGNYPVIASPAQFDEELPVAERAPSHGEHTELVLMEAGVEWDEIEALKTAGVIN